MAVEEPAARVGGFKGDLSSLVAIDQKGVSEWSQGTIRQNFLKVMTVQMHCMGKSGLVGNGNDEVLPKVQFSQGFIRDISDPIEGPYLPVSNKIPY